MALPSRVRHTTATVPSPCVTHSPASECFSNADCWQQYQTVLWICLEALEIAVKNQIIPGEKLLSTRLII